MFTVCSGGMVLTYAGMHMRDKKRNLWAVANIREDNKVLNTIIICIVPAKLNRFPGILVTPCYQHGAL